MFDRRADFGHNRTVAQHDIPVEQTNLIPEAMTTNRFEDFSWHDNAIHAFRIAEGDDGCSGQLTLDIDYIVKWISPIDEGGRFSFVVSPADLAFHEVTDLVISIDYASCSASLQPMRIGEIQREVFIYPNGHSSFSWKIDLNGPQDSFISFHSPRMSQVLKGEVVRSTSQWLMPFQRTM